jgi:hypothetical protein
MISNDEEKQNVMCNDMDIHTTRSEFWFPCDASSDYCRVKALNVRHDANLCYRSKPICTQNDVFLKSKERETNSLANTELPC